MAKSKKLQVVSFILFLNILLFSGMFFGYHAYKDGQRIKEIKHDYFSANQIALGMLDPMNWSNQVNEILQTQVDSFSLNAKNAAILDREIQKVMHLLFDEIEIVLNKEQENLKDKVKYGVLRNVVDLEKFKQRIPHFSNKVLDQIEKTSNKEDVKNALKTTVNKALRTSSEEAKLMRASILERYNVNTLESFNTKISALAYDIESKQKYRSWILIGLMVVMLLSWFLAIKLKNLLILTFIYCVILGFVNLIIALNLPMIEIDARIDQLDIPILSSNIIFLDQVIFYQSKSIFDVIQLMITKGKLDAIFVGALLFIFSIIFPAFKLICSIIYLFLKDKAGKVVKYIAFKSGKWSMADVMVIAIFMAFVGFQGILDAQLSDLEMAAGKINLLSTNRTNLQHGYLVFVAFVLSNLILSEILKYITKKDLLSEKDKPTTDEDESIQFKS